MRSWLKDESKSPSTSRRSDSSTARGSASSSHSSSESEPAVAHAVAIGGAVVLDHVDNERGAARQEDASQFTNGCGRIGNVMQNQNADGGINPN